MLLTWLIDIFDLYREFENVSTELRNLETGLASLIQGHLSPHLITFDLAKDVLDMVATRLRKSRPLEHLAITSAQEFYAIEDFYIQRKDNTLYLGIHIPVTFNSGRFHLYQINSHPLPAAMNSPHITYIKDVEEYLAQSTDRRFYFHPRQQDLFAHCTPGVNKICSYQPPLHDASQQLSCEYAIFINSEHITEQTCQYSIQTTVITPQITPLNATTYLIQNISEYTITCKDMSQTKKGCKTCFLLLQHSCGCVIQYDNTVIFPQYLDCESSITSTQVKYPRNLMVAKILLAEKDLSQFRANTFDDNDPDLALPNLKIFDTKMSDSVATDHQDALDLHKVLQNLQNNEVTYRHLADKLYDTHIQPLYAKTGIVKDILPWLNFILNVIAYTILLYVAWRLRILATAFVLRAHPTRAYDFDSDEIYEADTPSPTPWYHPLVITPTPHAATLLTALIFLIFAWCCKDLIVLGLNKIKWFRSFTIFWPASQSWDIVFQIAHKHNLITIYLGPVPSLMTDFSTITQNPITRVKVQTLLPFFIYKLTIMQEDGALLRKNGDIWRVPSCVHIGPLVARRIRYALTHPPLRYRVLIGQDGIFRSPPIYVESFPHQYQLPPRYIMETLNNAGHDQQPLMPHIPPPHTDLRAELHSAIQKHEKTQSVTLVAPIHGQRRGNSCTKCSFKHQHNRCPSKLIPNKQ